MSSEYASHWLRSGGVSLWTHTVGVEDQYCLNHVDEVCDDDGEMDRNANAFLSAFDRHISDADSILDPLRLLSQFSPNAGLTILIQHRARPLIGAAQVALSASSDVELGLII
jgi:hypothetical protein